MSFVWQPTDRTEYPSFDLHSDNIQLEVHVYIALGRYPIFSIVMAFGENDAVTERYMAWEYLMDKVRELEREYLI